MIELRMAGGEQAAAALTAIKTLAWDFPGEEALTLRVEAMRLVLGPEWRYDGSEACVAALEEFGEVTLHTG